MQAVHECPGDQIWMIGHTLETVYHNIIRLLFESKELKIFRHMCTWHPGSKQLTFLDKTIYCLGAKDERAIGPIQGKTFDLCYCDEITLYPENVIQMIDTRLSNPHSQLFASMNPVQPSHIVKKWIDAAEAGDSKFYSLHFKIDDNPFLTKAYKDRLKQTLTGLFYRRNYLGEWCLAEGAIFDFIEKGIHIVKRPYTSADYYLAGIDYGASNPFACLLVGYSSGKYSGEGPRMWVEKEFFYDPKNQRQKTNTEFARDVDNFLRDYPVKHIYIDPSAASFKVELRRMGYTILDADNDVYNGIMTLTNVLKEGTLTILEGCTNLIREMEGYVWDPAKSARGEDAPLKRDDHCFCQGTLIDTEKGKISIDLIEEGDRVYTRNGLKRVVKTDCNERNAFLFNLHGREYRCTPEHRFYTERGWIKIQELIASDILYERKDEWKPSDFREGCTDAIQSLKDTLTDCILKTTEGFTIEICGKASMEKYQKDIIYITKTSIPLTMICPIYSVYRDPNMMQFMGHLESLLRPLKQHMKPPSCGTNQRKDENGTLNTPMIASLEEGKRDPTSANSAALNTKHLKDQNIDFVRITVRPNGADSLELIMSQETAYHVASSSLSTNTLPPEAAQHLAVGVSLGLQKVYNLEVEDDHEYFANGILVHNCVDAMRYIIRSFLRGKSNLRQAKIEDEGYGKTLGVTPQPQIQFPSSFRY